MPDTKLGKRHRYTPEDLKSLFERAKELGFSSGELGELDRLYGEADVTPESSKLIKEKNL